MENLSQTTDYILTKYIGNCIDAFNIAIIERDKHLGIKHEKIEIANTNNKQPNDDTLFTTVQAASFLNIAEQTLCNWRVYGKGPVYHKMSDGPRGRVRYKFGDLKKYLRSRNKPECKK